MAVCLCPWSALSLGRDSYTGTRLCGQYLDKREGLRNVPGSDILMARRKSGALAVDPPPPNRIFNPLEPIHPGALQSRLADFTRNQGRGFPVRPEPVWTH